ncbi:MAG: MotA/TolQ/ExbB proton channel family protein [Bacteroidetes bacterium]|nr:MotA/TolQ/ExbB proton channel family protein [Bdellovibrionales bacterium]MCB0739275.1 MotA/TolQ/ExbB proton channel family protein [Bacteroidota bacterium]
MAGFFEIFVKSPMMIVNAIVSIFAVGVILERMFLLIFRYTADGRGFMQNIEKFVLANDLTQAINFSNTSSTPLATVVKAGLVKANRGGMAVSMGVDEALLQVTPQVEKRIGSLWAIANIATLIGLIGTILGIMTTFTSLSEASAEARAKLMGIGIAEALYNTAFGLLIAVGCIVAHLFLSGLAKKIIADLDYYSSRLENLLTLRHEAEKVA